MTQDTVLAYVKAAAALLALPLADDRAERVAGHLGRTAAMAAQLDAFALDVEDEPCEVYCPAPYPQPAPGPEGTR